VNKRHLLGYATLSLPLAMSMMPIYMISPKFYGDELGLELAALGAVLFFTRLLDTAQDPLIGRWVDARQHRQGGWTSLMLGAACALAVGFVLLFTPPAWSQTGLLVWLGGSLILVYGAHSVLSVCYLTWGARLTDDVTGRARVTAWREALGLVGVVVASVLPALWVVQQGARVGYQWFAWSFVVVLLLSLGCTLRWSPRPKLLSQQGRQGLREALAPTQVRRVLWFYLFNAISVAVPATLVLFFIDDVVQSPSHAGLFLGLYFVAGMLALPVWVVLAARVGKARAWLAGSGLAALALLCAAWVGAGDIYFYGVVCVLAGAGLGADVALPPAMLADAIPATHRQSTGLYFGIWVLIGKFALALAAGLALPALQVFQYQPGHPESALALSLIYAVLPLLFKGLALVVLFSKSSRSCLTRVCSRKESS
jgi:Na+/melibiose symporter-like transporter